MRFKDKFLFIIFSCLLFSLQAKGQDISVSSFKMMENDLTANTTGTLERDQNGEVAALIKIVTTEQGFSFDGGMVGVTKVKQEVGEVWVYVPHGIKKITIKHPQLGVLRDYYFPIPIEKARTYEMVLTTGKVQTFVNQSLKKQFVIFTVTPANAYVEFNGEQLELDETGYAAISMPYGAYTYRVTCPDYHTTAGSIEVKGGEKPEVNVNLIPNYGWLEVKVAPALHGANIYIDGKKEGVTPLDKKQMKSGLYRVRVEKPLYKDYEASVTIEDGKVFLLEVTQMEPNFAAVELVVDEKSEIWVDGVLKGTGKWSGSLGVGDHQVETKQMSHVPSSETIRIFDTEPRVIQLKKPTPLYSDMEIVSVPPRAKVYIDGEYVGETPMIQNEVLIGNRELVFEKDGYPRHTKYVMVNYGVICSVNANLNEASDNKPQSASTSQAVSSASSTTAKSTQVSQTSPTVTNTATTKKETVDEAGVKLKVKNPSSYSLYVDGRYKGYFIGDNYSLGSMRPGSYDVKVKSKKYVGNKLFYVNNNTTDLYLKTKRRNNYFHSNASIYAGGTFTVPYCLGGFKVGGYIKGVNAEFNYVTDSYNTWSDVRLGYGFNLGRNWLLTPQVGYFRWSWWSWDSNYINGQYYDDYGYPFGQSSSGEWYEYQRYEFDQGVSLACRVQHCFSRYVSVALTPVFFLGDYFDADVELSFILTLPFTKK